jgi:hypothetical protein
MQAGLVSRRLSFREVFIAVPQRILFVIIVIYVTVDLNRIKEQRLAA